MHANIFHVNKIETFVVASYQVTVEVFPLPTTFSQELLIRSGTVLFYRLISRLVTSRPSCILFYGSFPLRITCSPRLHHVWSHIHQYHRHVSTI